MKLKKIEVKLLKLLYFLAAGIVVFHAVSLDDKVTPMFYATFIIVMILWISIIKRNFSSRDFIVVSILILTFMNVIFNASMQNTDITFRYLKKVIMFSSTIVYFQTMSKIKIDARTSRYILRIFMVVSVILCVMYGIDHKNMYEFNGQITNYLTFKFTNPNLTGMFLTCITMVELIQIYKVRRWKKRVLHLILVCMLLYFIVETQSRNCLLVILGFSAIWIFACVMKHNKFKIGKMLSCIASVWPMIFVGIYFFVLNNRFLYNMAGFLVDEGKALSSRTRIWLKAMANFVNSPIIGSYSQISDGTGASQLHNSHLDILVSYGTIVFVLVCVLLYLIIYRQGKEYDNKENFIYMLAFIFAIMLGMGEAAIFSGGVGIYIYVGTFILLANSDYGIGKGKSVVHENRVLE